LLAAIAVAAISTGAAAADDRWIHVRVDDNEGGRARVDIQVPIGMVSGLLPVLNHRTAAGNLSFDDCDVKLDDLRTAWAAVRGAKDGQYVTVNDDDANVRIAKRGNLVLVNVDERDGGARVRVKLPLPLVDAALSRGDRIDLGAVVEALQAAPSGDLVTVEDGDTNVRIWIDAAPSPAREDAP
jgi:hypothetical protein